MNQVKLLLLLCLGALCQTKTFNCEFCTKFIDFAKQLLKGKDFTETYLDSYNSACLERGQPDYCFEVTQIANITVYPLLVSTIDTEMICSLAGYCKEAVYLEDKINDYARRVLNSSLRSKVNEEQVEKSVKPIRLLVVGDIHIDYNYTEVLCFVLVRDEVERFVSHKFVAEMIVHYQRMRMTFQGSLVFLANAIFPWLQLRVLLRLLQKKNPTLLYYWGIILITVY